MQPLKPRLAAPAPTAPRRDPAPSRLNYRVQRLWLTPMFRRLLWVGLPLFVLGLAAAIYLADQGRRDALALSIEGAKAAVRERPEFMVRLMAIDGASEGVAEDIREALPVDFPISSFSLDLPLMLADVMALDAVARADLRVRPGGVLQVSIVERVPVAIWRNDGALDLLDIDGHRVKPLAHRSERPDLPLIAGGGADAAVAEAVALVAAAQPLADRMRGLVRMGERRWDVVLDGEQTILLPEAEPVRALEQVLALNEAQDLLARDVVAVDIRTVGRPTLRLGAAATDALATIRVLELGDD